MATGTASRTVTGRGLINGPSAGTGCLHEECYEASAIYEWQSGVPAEDAGGFVECGDRELDEPTIRSLVALLSQLAASVQPDPTRERITAILGTAISPHGQRAPLRQLAL
jgi:hypothetical protein